MASKEFKNWAIEQAKKHKSDEKITNWQKLTSGYIINDYETWGELFDSLGIKSTYKEPVQGPLTAEQLSEKVDLLTRKVDLNRRQAMATNVSDAERQKAINEFKRASDLLLQAKADLIDAQVKEGLVKKADTYKTTSDNIRFDIKLLEEQRKMLSDAGLSTATVDAQIKDKNQQLQESEKLRTKTETTLSTLTGPTTTVNAPTGTTILRGPTGPTGTTLTGPSGPSGPRGGTPSGPRGGTGTGNGTGTGTGTGTGAGTGGAGTGTPAPADTKTPEQRYAEAIAKAQELYNMPDIVFKNVPSLNALLKKYVNKELTDEQFAREIQNDIWYRTNSDEIKKRYVQLFNYQDLVNSGQAKGTTNYEQELERITRQVQAEARRLRGVELSDSDAKLIAQDLYIYNLDKDSAVVTERLARFIKPVAGMIGGQGTTGYGGEALQNYQTLQSFAKANGFKIEDVLPRDPAGNAMTAESTLQALATGKLDINRIAQDIRKLAAQGQPDYVRELLGQGYDLEQIYAPYRNRMASILEVDPNTIKLSDSALRMAIGKDGDMNLYDYEKALRKDSRWQYTKQAREEVSSATLKVLRDFGFMG